MAQYAEEFAKQRQRRAVREDRELLCRVCLADEVDTASDYEWPCLILEDWICETHCTEVKLKDFGPTRERVLGLLVVGIPNAGFESDSDLQTLPVLRLFRAALGVMGVGNN